MLYSNLFFFVIRQWNGSTDIDANDDEIFWNWKTLFTSSHENASGTLQLIFFFSFTKFSHLSVCVAAKRTMLMLKTQFHDPLNMFIALDFYFFPFRNHFFSLSCALHYELWVKNKIWWRFFFCYCWWPKLIVLCVETKKKKGDQFSFRPFRILLLPPNSRYYRIFIFETTIKWNDSDTLLNTLAS